VTEIIDLGRVFPDERFSPLEHSGYVSCLHCGKKVSVLTAAKVEHSAGPTGFLHMTCVEEFTSGLEVKAAYHDAVRAAVANHHRLPSE
jgi:hypothetical protein